jgi:hypothetical protein
VSPPYLAVLDRPQFRVTDLRYSDGSRSPGVAVLFENEAAAVDVFLTAAQANQIASGLLRHAQRAERALKIVKAKRVLRGAS